VTDAVFLLRADLSRGFPVLGQNEQRVIAKAVLTLLLKSDFAVHVALCGNQSAVGACQSNGTGVVCTAVSDTLQLLQKKLIVCLVITMSAAETGGIDAGGTAQGIHADTAVVCNGTATGDFRNLTGFFHGIFHKGGAVFNRFVVDTRFPHGNDLFKKIPQYLLDFNQLMLIVGCNNQVHGITSKITLRYSNKNTIFCKAELKALLQNISLEMDLPDVVNYSYKSKRRLPKMEKKSAVRLDGANQAGRKEYLAYCLFFLGQNLLWGYAGYIETFLTDIGITAAVAAAILIIPKLWDAVNDVLFGYIVDRHMFKNGQKFLPWVRIGTSAVGITTVAMFAIPQSMSDTVKVVWFLVAYILFDLCYTILDAPAFATATVMTSDLQERTKIIAGGKLWSMVGGVVATVIIPMIRPSLGWFAACIVFCAVSVLLMLPMLFTVHERHTETVRASENPDIREMLVYLKNNRYLFTALLALLILGLSSVEQKMAIYMGRICLGQENMATLVAGGAAISVIAVSAIVPALAKRWDKFDVLCAGILFAIVMDIVAWFVGYDSIPAAIAMTMLKCTGLGFWQVIVYMLIADTVEYGMYKSGTRAAGLTFSLQAFAAKLKNALIGSIVLISLSTVGFVEGENAVQPAGVAPGVWNLFCLLPACGFAVALVLLRVFYRLRSDDVQVMSRYNNGEISREEADAQLCERYGAAAEHK